MQVKFSDEVEEEIRKLFFDDGTTLESVTLNAESALIDLSITLPDFFDENVERANDVCSPDGTLNLGYVSSDPPFKKNTVPFSNFIASQNLKTKMGFYKMRK